MPFLAYNYIIEKKENVQNHSQAKFRPISFIWVPAKRASLRGNSKVQSALLQKQLQPTFKIHINFKTYKKQDLFSHRGQENCRKEWKKSRDQHPNQHFIGPFQHEPGKRERLDLQVKKRNENLQERLQEISESSGALLTVKPFNWWFQYCYFSIWLLHNYSVQ